VLTYTGKIGQYHIAEYYFKQAYLKWDYKSIPLFEDYLYSVYNTITTIHQFTVEYYSNDIWKPQCNFHYSWYQTQESFNEQKIFLKIWFDPVSIPVILEDIHWLNHTEIINQTPDSGPFNFTLPESLKIYGDIKVYADLKHPVQNYSFTCSSTDVIFAPPVDIPLILKLDLPIELEPFTNTGILNFYASLKESSFIYVLGTIPDDVITPEVLYSKGGMHLNVSSSSIQISNQTQFYPVLVGLKQEDMQIDFINIGTNPSYGIIYFDLHSSQDQQLSG